MREIKFRGVTTNGKLIYGFPFFYEDGTISIFVDKFSHYGCEATEIFNRRLIVTETLSQFTGLKDKNGKEVYEGDICRCPTYYVPEGQFIIKWQGKGFTMAPSLELESIENFWFNSFEVIGNIYDK